MTSLPPASPPKQAGSLPRVESPALSWTRTRAVEASENWIDCAARNSTYCNHSMPTETFQASRWTRGNFLFPTVIEVTDKAVVRRKRSWFSRDEISISMKKIASVHIKTGVIWAEVLIESSGGSDPLTSHGHRKADARRLKELIEDFQSKPAPDEERGQQMTGPD